MVAQYKSNIPVEAIQWNGSNVVEVLAFFDGKSYDSYLKKINSSEQAEDEFTTLSQEIKENGLFIPKVLNNFAPMVSVGSFLVRERGGIDVYSEKDFKLKFSQVGPVELPPNHLKAASIMALQLKSRFKDCENDLQLLATITQTLMMGAQYLVLQDVIKTVIDEPLSMRGIVYQKESGEFEIGYYNARECPWSDWVKRHKLVMWYYPESVTKLIKL